MRRDITRKDLTPGVLGAIRDIYAEETTALQGGAAFNAEGLESPSGAYDKYHHYDEELRKCIIDALELMLTEPSNSEMLLGPQGTLQSGPGSISDVMLLGQLVTLQRRLNSWSHACIFARELCRQYYVDDKASSRQVDSLRHALLDKLEATHRDWYDKPNVGNPNVDNLNVLFMHKLSAAAEEHVQSHRSTSCCGILTQARGAVFGYKPPSERFLSKLAERTPPSGGWRNGPAR